MSGAHRSPRRHGRGRPGQPDGKHTIEHVTAVDGGAVGHAGRVTLAQHLEAGPDRGGRDDPDAMAIAAAQRRNGHVREK